ncbi:SWIRM domain-containing protein [Microdochium trichocladiopsis]|uniref:SWIRM domain-containing protein n=1 Tax=Microdochium trichocladiopsis TaxID=1682393 RepID=A0A9P8XUM8_9PEZI|nr:SWIRM domain-containing protein [Microdochium trichocladiopsis]KAH7018221.1 SWIRM domain-containing protein [Microdochium trichocladiopsis]
MTTNQHWGQRSAPRPFSFFDSLRPSSTISHRTDPMASSSATPRAYKPETAHTTAEPTKPFDTSILMSPPEPPRYESFADRTASVSVKTMDSITVADVRRGSAPKQPLSPPISPAARVDDRLSSGELSPTIPVKDPILYPTPSSGPSPPQPPLFSREDVLVTRKIVDDHLVARPSRLFQQSTPPQREDYELMLFFKSHVMKRYNENPKGWLRRERAQLLADRKAGARHNQFKLHPILPAKPQAIRTMAQRVVKPAAKPARTITVAAPRPIRANPPASTPRQPAVRVRKTTPTPDPSSRRVVAPNREDKEFALLPDYCPPLSSLPSKANSLKVDWKGAPIDLSTDPHRGLLHPDEVMLAANLRLDCATYLTSKRRMFIRRLECLRVGKEFRKTDAQQACKIDVNKASKLWTAFDKVGWLEKGWVSRFL